MQATHIGYPLAKLNIRATAGHVGGNRNHSGLPGLCNNFRFFFMILGIEHMMFYAGTG